MSNQQTFSDAHTQFGIDEIYIHNGLDDNLLKKLHQRAVLTLDASEDFIFKNVSKDIILIFHRRVQDVHLIYKFLKFLNQSSDKDSFIDSHTLLNEEELFSAIKSKTFVLITHKDITSE